MRVLLGTLAAYLVACSVEPQRAADDLGPVETVPLEHVRLLAGPFKDAQDKNFAYVMAMDPDRLLAPFLVEAGLEPRAANYGNWEGSGLNGHIGGHYLSALSLAWAATGRQEVLDRLDHMLDELERAQEANGDGYLGGVPGGKTLWRQIASGDVRAEPFGLNGAWVPWYNLHKTFAGLHDAWVVADRQKARGMLVKLADWAAEIVSGLSDEQVQTMLRTEHGGMNEVLADVAAITGDGRYLELADRFSHRAILDPLLQGEDRLDGLHANTQIPKVVGFERIVEVGGRPVERLPDGSDYLAMLYGPIVLSAETTPFEDEVLDDYADDGRMGHIPSGAACPLERAPILVSGSSAEPSAPRDLAEHIQRVDDRQLRFRFRGTIDPAAYADVELVPFFRVHHSRYMLYWPHSTPEGIEARRAALGRTDAVSKEEP